MKTLARFSPALLAGALIALMLIPGDAQGIGAVCDVEVTADAVDLALDFVPCINVVKDVVALGLGVNPVTGDPLSERDAAFLIAWIVLPGMFRMARASWPWRSGDKLTPLPEAPENAEELPVIVEQAAA